MATGYARVSRQGKGTEMWDVCGTRAGAEALVKQSVRVSAETSLALLLQPAALHNLWIGRRHPGGIPVRQTVVVIIRHHPAICVHAGA